ncbi:MAG: HAMP domain-containing sensor histidine kinase [Candidatus Alcyoniella australis]|nr:HAMP domain-containing sensor histidine kinase [Candidatus Alcyoniella australis]
MKQSSADLRKRVNQILEIAPEQVVQIPGEEIQLLIRELVAVHTRLAEKTQILESNGRDRSRNPLVNDISNRHSSLVPQSQLAAQLQQAQKLEAIGTLASGVAHEINNPLAAILNFAELISEEQENSESSRDYATRIVAETKRVADIVRNLLAFTQPESKDSCGLQISELIVTSLSLVHTMLCKDLIEVFIDVNDELPPVCGNGQKIQQVLVNLLTNARDALNEKHVEPDKDKLLLINAKSELRKEQPGVVIEIEDHGAGIERDIIHRIFDPFFSTKPHGQGSGLGLSISYNIIKQHQGELTVESLPGQYTRFQIWLPAALKAQDNATE